MPYVGRQNVTGEFIKLDAITTSATNTFNLLRNGAAFSPATAEQCIVSVNGVTQAPQDAFNVSGSQIVFTSTLSSNDVIDYILVMGNALSAGVPSDGSVSSSKLASNSVTNAKIVNSTIDLTSKVTGILPTANGGIGFTSTTRPAFSVRITTTSATNSTNIFANTRLVAFNQGNHFQESGGNLGKFVAPVAGLYFFRVEGFSSNSANNNSAANTTIFHLTKNGNTANDILGREHYGYSRYEDHTPLVLVELQVLAANDAIGVRIGSGYMYSNNNARSPVFSGCLIG